MGSTAPKRSAPRKRVDTVAWAIVTGEDYIEAVDPSRKEATNSLQYYVCDARVIRVRITEIPPKARKKGRGK